MILNFVELSKNLLFTNKALSKFYANAIEISQSVGFASTCTIIYQSTSFFKNEELILTPKLLLDYGLVHHLICSDPNQVTNFGRKMALGFVQGFKSNKKFTDVIIISKAPKWVSLSVGSLLPAQHNVYFHYQNRRPTLLSCPLEFTDICVEPLINKIRHWRARIISKDLKHIQRTWVISLLQILFTRFSIVRELIIYQPSSLLRILS